MMYFYFLGSFFLILNLLLVMLLFPTFIKEHSYILEWNFNTMSPITLKLYIYMDYMSNIFLMVISLISMTVFFYSYYYMMSDKMKNKFLILTFLFIFSMFIMVTNLNFFMILIGWDGLGISSYLLILHYSSNNSDYSSFVTIMTNRIGDIGMIFSFFFLMQFKTFDLMNINWLQNYNYLLILTLSTAVMTKSAQFPFSVWLPLAMAAPTPISSLVHSSTLVTAGVYLFIRMNKLFDLNNFKYSLFIIILCLFTSLMASISALSETDIKKIIAFSTLSQISLMMIILLLGEEMMSFYHILTHAMFKALLFLCSGVMIHEYLENQDLRKFPQMMKINIFILSIFFICSLSLMGFPFLSGFYSKDLILEKIYTLNCNAFLTISMIFSTLMTSMYSFRMILFSSLKGKPNLKMLIIFRWNSLYNTLIIMMIFVVMFGASLNWMFLDKIKTPYLKMNIKLINMLLILISLQIFIYSNLSFKSKYFKFLNSMFFLTNYQGHISSFIFNKLIYFSSHSEMMFETIFKESINKMSNLFNQKMNMMKYTMIYMSIMYALAMYFMYKSV